jgi:hypothetical protein
MNYETAKTILETYRLPLTSEEEARYRQALIVVSGRFTRVPQEDDSDE